jgi:DNA invertase Pin-like site-specific DNA recombinase
MTQTTRPQAVAYIRTATLEPTTRLAVEWQRRVCESYAYRLGAAIGSTYTDIAVRGTRRHRPALDQLLRDLPRRRPRYVVAADAARVARDMHIEAQIRRDIARHGTQLVTGIPPANTQEN